jgi:hypothetical protein
MQKLTCHGNVGLGLPRGRTGIPVPSQSATPNPAVPRPKRNLRREDELDAEACRQSNVTLHSLLLEAACAIESVALADALSALPLWHPSLAAGRAW